MIDKPLLQIFDSTNNRYSPIWFMRQAGRYLPEYRQIRSDLKTFLDLCYDSNLASEVTLQPLRRFAFDAAIIFSDILVVPHALGVKVKFVSNEGPVLDPVRNMNALNKLKFDENILLPVYESIENVKKSLSEDKALFGFSGAPWTLACYMIDGRGVKDFPQTCKALYTDSNFFDKLVDVLTECVIIHLKNQIRSGADIVQIFDSWAGILTEEKFLKYVILPTKKIVSAIKKFDSSVKIIGFPRGAGLKYKDYQNTGVDAISIDQFTSLYWAKENLSCVIQGNLDPLLLAYDKKAAIEYSRKILNLFGGKGFIFNLGHGVIPQTPVENVEAVVNEVVKFNNS